MISWTKLLTGISGDHDDLRYSKAYRDPVPKIVVWNTTSSCNLNCQHCYFDASKYKDADELSQEEVKDFILDLARLRVSVFLFSGGEPLLRKDIFQLGKFAQDSGIMAVLSTNGTLITKEVAKEIKEAGFFYVGISLDGKPATHDKFRRKKGAFDEALAGLKNCQRLSLKVGLRFTLTRYNFRDLPYIFELVERESIPRLCIYHLVYSGRGRNFNARDLNHHERREVLELIRQKTLDFYQKGLKIEVLTVDNHVDGIWLYLKLKSRNLKRAQMALELLELQGGNGSGINLAALDNRGNIYPDQFWRNHPLGNIRKVRFSDVWRDKDNHFLQALRNRRLYLKGRCQRCNFISICNGNLRARAEAVFGNLWAEDPACYLSEKEISSNIRFALNEQDL